jgi:spore coat polysaccharide biosynthesis protein SpsF (cytidylyltransferase family)/aryl-alcohol dehydrogenase-like predicted oxidoreductase
MPARTIVILQSRFNSKRLPGKALYPINGYPLVILSALRASNTGRHILVATSKEPSDDELCSVLNKYSIKFFRGSLDNVLDRFSEALKDYNDDDIVFRLTADNVLPDGLLLDEIEKQFLEQKLDILSCSPEGSGLPYGLSAEIMRVKSIRLARESAKSAHDLEHVTPYIYRNLSSGFYRSEMLQGRSHFRVTIDTLDDYVCVRSLFAGVEDVVNEPLTSLFQRLNAMKYRPFYEPACKPMTLGTVQFGMNYGITNSGGRVLENESTEIIKCAVTEGVEYLDTASCYGDSETVIGNALLGGWRNRVKIITKLKPFNPSDYKDKAGGLAVRNSFLTSCLRLNVSKVDVLLFHRHENTKNKYMLDEALSIKSQSLCADIGVSVQSPSELLDVLDNANFTFIQMPYNILDHRWNDAIPLIMQAKKQRRLIVHARSALLQGLLCSNKESDWSKAGITDSLEIIQWLEASSKRHLKMSISDLCIGFVNSQPWIDSAVIGVLSKDQLYKNLQSISMPLMSTDALSDLTQTRPLVPESSLDPSNWS